MGPADRRVSTVPVEPSSPVADMQQFAAHVGALRVVAAGLCRSCRACELDDLVQDTLERALRHVGAGRPMPDHPRAWLVSILRNVFIDRLRAARPDHEPIADPPAPPAVVEPAWAELSIDDVRGVLADLDPPLRDAFDLHYLRGKRYAEVAAALGIPMNTVASRLHRARKAVRDALVARRPHAEPGR